MRKGTCKHFRGFIHRHCAAGVDMVAFNGGVPDALALNLPCNGAMDSARRAKGITAIPCDLYEEPSEADIAEFKKAFQSAIDGMTKAQPLFDRIRKQHKGKSASGVEDCPVCGTPDALHWSIAGCNGHLGARCKTKDCIAFRE